MEKKKESIILVDFKYNDNWDFKINLEKKTGLTFKCELLDSNMWQGKITKLFRYGSYFFLPLFTAFKYKNIDNLIAWQQFYGLLYAFWCKILHIRKPNKLIVMTFIYRRKSGFMGELYDRFINYIVKAEIVDYYICFSESECKHYESLFHTKKSKFVSCKLSEQDLFDKYRNLIEDGECYVAAGRSNRDYDFLCDSFSKMTDKKLIIVCDTYYNSNITENITIVRDARGDSYFEYLAKAKAVIVPLHRNTEISSGQLVMIHAMMLGKICIVTDTNQSEEYIDNLNNGILIDNSFTSLHRVIENIENSQYDYIKNNARNCYLKNYSNENLSDTVTHMLID